ncbi:MAG TPA: molybdopterin-binding protein [Methylomirabilota bacterium]|jgi:molybdenum cofactor synthesis domain-containing protein|nr:molybdopterin-binding protein [Methylomirabilota bacterium]
MAKTAGILLIGNEILSGKITDANAAYLCRELRALGVEVRRITVIPDEVDLIAAEVRAFSAAYDVVFTSGGVGPTHDDVTIEGVARALDVPVIREPRLVEVLERYFKGQLNEARLKMAEIPQGAELTADGALVFPAVVVRNIYILPGVPEIFRQKFDSLKERFRETPFHLCCVYVSMGEGTLADHLNAVLAAHPDLMLGSYPEFANPDYKVKVTLESKDRAYLDSAVGHLLDRLPTDAVVRVER